MGRLGSSGHLPLAAVSLRTRNELTWKITITMSAESFSSLKGWLTGQPKSAGWINLHQANASIPAEMVVHEAAEVRETNGERETEGESLFGMSGLT